MTALLALAASLREIGPALANHLWQSTVFAGVAAVLTLALRSNHARARHWIWMAASLKFVVPFAVLVALGSHLAMPRASAPARQDAVYFAVQEASQTLAAQVAPVIAPVATLERSEISALLPLVCGAVWLGGFLAVLLRWAARWRRVALELRAANPVCEGRIWEALRRIERAAGIRRPIDLKLLTGARTMEPGVFGLGLARPVLAWPEAISELLDDQHLESILAHEVCHVRRRDNLAAAVHMLVEAAFWFHPLVWWLGGRLVEERERACDEEVLLVCGRPRVYAESILKVCEFCVESPVACVSGVTGADLKRRVMQIMAERAARKLDLGRKLLLATTAIGAVAGPVGFGVMQMIPIYGQVFHATGPMPAYEVAVIKPSKEDAHGASTTGEQTHYLVTAKILIRFAYGMYSPPKVNDLQVLGGPDWINSDVFDIVGKMPAAEFELEQNLNRTKKHERRQLMEQSLLAERFKLKMHTEMRNQPVYALTVVKGGLKMTPAKDATGSARVNPSPSSADPAALKRGLIVNPRPGALVMTVKGMTLDMFVNALMEQKEMGGRPVVNQTGLTDAYDFTLTWGVEEAPSAESGVAEEPPLLTAIQQQLGLKLVQTKGPAEVVVIDQIEKPSLDGKEAAGLGRDGLPGTEVASRR